MKDYKYISFNEDVLIYPAEELIYHKNQIYEIEEIYNSNNTPWVVRSDNETLLIKTKNPSFVKYADNANLFTLLEMRNLKLNKIKRKI